MTMCFDFRCQKYVWQKQKSQLKVCMEGKIINLSSVEIESPRISTSMCESRNIIRIQVVGMICNKDLEVFNIYLNIGFMKPYSITQ